jgi:hypothetical protein
MIISDLNFEGIPIAPYKAYAILIIDPYTVLSCAAPFQRLKSISWENRNIRERNGRMDLHQFSFDDRSQSVESLGISTLEN